MSCKLCTGSLMLGTPRKHSSPLSLIFYPPTRSFHTKAEPSIQIITSEYSNTLSHPPFIPLNHFSNIELNHLTAPSGTEVPDYSPSDHQKNSVSPLDHHILDQHLHDQRIALHPSESIRIVADGAYTPNRESNHVLEHHIIDQHVLDHQRSQQPHPPASHLPLTPTPAQPIPSSPDAYIPNSTTNHIIENHIIDQHLHDQHVLSQRALHATTTTQQIQEKSVPYNPASPNHLPLDNKSNAPPDLLSSNSTPLPPSSKQINKSKRDISAHPSHKPRFSHSSNSHLPNPHPSNPHPSNLHSSNPHPPSSSQQFQTNNRFNRKSSSPPRNHQFPIDRPNRPLGPNLPGKSGHKWNTTSTHIPPPGRPSSSAEPTSSSPSPTHSFSPMDTLSPSHDTSSNFQAQAETARLPEIPQSTTYTTDSSLPPSSSEYIYDPNYAYYHDPAYASYLYAAYYQTLPEPSSDTSATATTAEFSPLTSSPSPTSSPVTPDLPSSSESTTSPAVFPPRPRTSKKPSTVKKEDSPAYLSHPPKEKTLEGFNNKIARSLRGRFLRPCMDLYTQMQALSISPDLTTYHLLISAHIRTPAALHANHLFAELLERKLVPTLEIYNLLFAANETQPAYCDMIYAHMRAAGIAPDVDSVRKLIVAHLRNTPGETQTLRRTNELLWDLCMSFNPPSTPSSTPLPSQPTTSHSITPSNADPTTPSTSELDTSTSTSPLNPPIGTSASSTPPAADVPPSPTDSGSILASSPLPLPSTPTDPLAAISTPPIPSFPPSILPLLTDIFNKVLGAVPVHAMAQVYASMRAQGVPPDAVTFTTLLRGPSSKSVDLNEHENAVLGEMLAHGVALNVVTYNTLIMHATHRKDVVRCKQLYEAMNAQGLEPNLITYLTHTNANSPSSPFSSLPSTFPSFSFLLLSPLSHIPLVSLSLTLSPSPTPSLHPSSPPFILTLFDGTRYKALTLFMARIGEHDFCWSIMEDMKKNGWS